MTRRGRDRTTLPDRDECVSILRNCGCEDRVIAHCESVCRLAVKIARLCGARIALVEAGAMLHDLGRCKTHSIHHAVEGAAIARDRGLPESLVNIIERHIGGGISEEEAAVLGLPPKSYLPETLEEKVVAHADNLIDGTRKVNIRTAVAELTRRGLDRAAKRSSDLHEELSGIAGTDLDELR